MGNTPLNMTLFMRKSLLLALSVVALTNLASSQHSHIEDVYLEMEDFRRSDLLGVDRNGVPMLCGVGDNGLAAPLSQNNELRQQWEVIPSVLRADSSEPIYIYVQPNREAQRVRLVLPTSDIQMPDDLDFHDDGLNGDAVEGDGVYTLGPFKLLENQADLTRKPSVVKIGTIQVVDPDDSIKTFLTFASLGVLPSAFEEKPVFRLNDRVQLTADLLNYRSDSLKSQELLRGMSYERLSSYMSELYQVVEDDYDFVVMLSSGKLEVPDPGSSRNAHIGICRVAKSPPLRGDWSQSRLYGSNGRLAAICSLDYQDRGMEPSNLMHEILHRWGAAFDSSLNYQLASGHYDLDSNAGSILGGYRWIEQGDDSFEIDYMNGSNSAYRAGECDLFSMGLLPLDEMSNLYVAADGHTDSGTRTVTSGDIVRTITAEDIALAQGENLPDWERPQTRFRILFVVESRDRFLNADEMTYYSAFVEEAMRVVDVSEPDPHIAHEWAPITRYFGDRVQWDHRLFIRSSVLDPFEDHDSDGFASIMENRIGTNAFDRNSKPWLKLVRDGESRAIEMRHYEPHMTVEIQRSDDLRSWSAIEPGSDYTEDGEAILLEADNAGFFRLFLEVWQGGLGEGGTNPEILDTIE